MDLVLLIVLWPVWCLVNAAIAAQKGRSPLAHLFFSLLLSPILGYLYLLAVPAKEPQIGSVSKDGSNWLAEQPAALQVVIYFIGVLIVVGIIGMILVKFKQ